ncbi:3-oxoacyl-ACP synthase [Tumebacillus sp. DT12]|uniref:3-oxoacyl-ACP synthase n=1 Tax=Tumebacillus lacus TaxID=2995335 RepID=A0ABT3WYK8_9BACL|nr:3-oxoacyl-ACP synthase [Tumebacillus lacus]MCX7568842.1 3-oxoacyl-ACP synthase [Tumebacillus lacus]
MNQTAIGIVSTGVYLPSTYQTSREISEQSGIPQEIIETKMGFSRKTIPGPDDHTCQMGIWAAQRAIEKGGIDPATIDLVIYVGEEHKEYPLWTAGIKLQQEVGALNAWAFDVQQRCGTMVMALKVAKDMMIADPEIQTVLLAGGYRNSDFIDYTNPRTRFMYNLAAGGAAVILKKGHEENVLLGSHIITDGSFSEDVAVVAGGTKHPISAEAIEKRLNYLDVMDPEGMKQRLEQKSMDNFIKVMEKALAKSGLTHDDIDYLSILHMKRSAHDYVLRHFGLNEEQSVYLSEYGHIGQIDQILSLELGLENGRIKDGDRIVMVSAGIGYAWDACVVQWGKAHSV